jgi:hypothetical protein
MTLKATPNGALKRRGAHLGRALGVRTGLRNDYTMVGPPTPRLIPPA